MQCLDLLDYAAATDLPPMDQLLKNPESFDIKALKPGSVFLLGQSLISSATEDNIQAVLKVMSRMPDNHKAINFMGLTALPPRQLTGLMQSPEFTQFVADNHDLLTIVSEAK